MSWETCEVKQRLWGSITYTKRDLCTFLELADVWSCGAACLAGRASGPWGSIQVLPYGSAPTLPILIILSLMWNSILFQKSKPSVSDRCRRLLSVFSVDSHTPLCLISLLFSEHRFTGGFCIISFRCTPSLSVCACLSTCLVVQTNMINEAIGVSRMSCDQRAFDVWHF